MSTARCAFCCPATAMCNITTFVRGSLIGRPAVQAQAAIDNGLDRSAENGLCGWGVFSSRMCLLLLAGLFSCCRTARTCQSSFASALGGCFRASGSCRILCRFSCAPRRDHGFRVCVCSGNFLLGFAFVLNRRRGLFSLRLLSPGFQIQLASHYAPTKHSLVLSLPCVQFASPSAATSCSDSRL